MEDINGFGKILFDKKTISILDATKNEALTIKEISKKINETTTSLYYPVKKLLEIQALKINKEEKVKNLTEYYYTSSHLQLKGSMSFEGDLLEVNKDELIQTFLFEVNKAAQALNQDIELHRLDEKYIKSTSELSVVNKRISYENWKELNQKIRELIEGFEDNQQEQNEYNFLIASYESE